MSKSLMNSFLTRTKKGKFLVSSVITTAITVFATAFAMMSCTQSRDSASFPKQGSAIFKFDTDEITSFEIMNNDPMSATRWSVKLSKQKHQTGNAEFWRIDSSDLELADKIADAAFVSHLLDTLGTLTYTDLSPNGPLESLGLSPPAYALRWRGGNKSYELQLGAPTKNKRRQAIVGNFASKPVIVQGATLEMLSRLGSIDSIRKRSLLTAHPDDLFQIEFQRAGKTVLSATREGDDWADSKQKRLSRLSVSAIENIMHARIAAFIDGPEDNRKALISLAQSCPFKAIFKDRFGNSDHICAGYASGKFQATVESRPGAAFEIFPEMIRSIAQAAGT